jgi:hypothetical protein
VAKHLGVLIMRKDYDIVGSYDNQRFPSICAERTVNMFEYLDQNAKRPKVLLPTSGLLDAQLDFGAETTGVRAQFVFKDKTQISFYTVIGVNVYRTIGTTGALTTIQINSEPLSTPTGFIGIDANQYQVMFVDGLSGWIWDTNANTWNKITDTSFPIKPIDVTFLDGFFVVANGETNNFQLSMINQGMVWGGGQGVPVVFTSSAVTDELTLTATNTANFATGVPITLSNTGGGTLPVVVGTPLNTTTQYFVIRVTPVTTNPGRIKLARTYADAIAGIAIDITVASVAPVQVNVVGQLQLGSITSHPGTIVACRTLHRRLFLFSQNFTEVWENAGAGTNLPFRRNNSSLMEVGTPAIGSIATGFDRMFFLSQDKDGLGAVMGVSGTESMPVSNRALDFQLAQYAQDPTTGVADARGVMIKENGIIFYRLNFTLANHTFVLNVTTSEPGQPRWHEEEALNHDRHVAQTHVYFGGVNYYGDYKRPMVYVVDDSFLTNNGEQIRRMRIGRQISPEGYNRLRIDRFQLDVIQGQAGSPIFFNNNLLTEDSFDLLTETDIVLLLEQSTQLLQAGPQLSIWLTISKDGGQTYGYYTESTMGKIGERTHRTVWRKLGTTPRGQGYTPKIEFFSVASFIILGAAWDYEILPE